MNPICYLRTLDGKPDWSEDCMGDDPKTVLIGYEGERYAAIPLYAHPPVEQSPEWRRELPPEAHVTRWKGVNLEPPATTYAEADQRSRESHSERGG